MLKRVNNFFRTTLIGGMLVLLPITIFVWLVKLIFDFILRIIRPLTNILDFGQITNELLLSLIAIGIIILFCFLVGLFVRTRSGKAIFGYFDRELLNRLPFYNTIKETVQQFTGAKKGPFSQVILVDAFGNGTRQALLPDQASQRQNHKTVPAGQAGSARTGAVDARESI